MKVHKEFDRKIKIKNIAKLLAGLIVGFLFFTVSSHHKSPVFQKLPERKLKNISYFPNVKIHNKDRYYHIHHWMIFTALYAPFILIRRRLRSKLLHGLFLGSIFQGFTYKDRFRIKYHSKAQTQ